jgi:tetratricopeptide (TPR) repeat protein
MTTGRISSRRNGGAWRVRRRLLAGLAAVWVLAAPAAAGTWADRGEYDLVLTIRAEASPDKQVALLDQWKEKYPKTEHRQARRELYLSAYRSLRTWPRVLEVAREMVADQPDNLVGLYWVTLLLPATADAAGPDVLNDGEKAARLLLDGLAGFFSPAGKPTSTTEAEWSGRKAHVEVAAHRTLGWIHWQRGAYEAAEQELAACLRVKPNDAEISAWYGAVAGMQKGLEKQAAALWHLARASSLQGEGALADGPRREVSATLDRVYTAFLGAPDGLEELRSGAAANPFPQAGFLVETAAKASARREEEELNRTNPQLAAWLRIRKRLEAPDGDNYFAEHLTAVPLPRLKGTLIRGAPLAKPVEIVLGIQNPAAEEVVLKLDAPFPHSADAGTEVEFEGFASSFTREPFILTVTAARDKVVGWPERKPGRD